MLMKLMTIIVVILLAVLPVSAQFEDCFWDTLTHNNMQEILSFQSLAVNGYEEAHLTYGRARADSGFDIYYRYYSLYDGFQPEVTIDSVKGCFNPVIASIFGDDESKITIAYEAAGQIWLGTVNSPEQTWQFEVISDMGVENMTPTIDYGNFLQLAWVVDRGADYKIAYADDSIDSLHIEIIEESELGDYGSGADPFIIAIGSEPHIFYRGVNNGHYNIHHAYRTHPDSSWIIEYLATPNADDFHAVADHNNIRDIYLAISGNEGWGMPGHIYYLKRDHTTLQWSSPELVTGQYSATNPSITERPGDDVLIASCGISGNFYDGHIYVSNNYSGQFETDLLATYPWVTLPVLADIIGEYEMLVFNAPIGGESNEDVELVCLEPDLAISVDEQPLPSKVNYLRNYPNPFNTSTLIKYNLPTQSQTTLEIYDILGRKVTTLYNGPQAAGGHQLVWNAADLSSGVYFYKLTAGDYIETRRMTLVK